MYRREPKGGGGAFGAALAKASAVAAVEVLPENWRAFDLFASLSTQWSAGMGGATGLRYEAIYPLLDRMTSTREEWDRLFDDIRVMEASALLAMQDDTP